MLESQGMVENELVSNELDDFEFDFDFDENTWNPLLGDNNLSGNSNPTEAHLIKVPLGPPAKAKRGTQFMHKRIPSKATKRKQQRDLERKNANISSTLRPAPTLDKPQSLLYFPHNFCRLVNSGDQAALGKLLNQHLEKACNVTMFGHNMDVRTFWAMNVLMRDITPDVIMCVHATKVVDNRVRSAAYLKYTDKKVLFEAATKNISNAQVKEMFGTERNKKLKKTLKAGNQERSLAEEEYYNTLVEADMDVVMYVALEIVLTFDLHTRKVTDMLLDTRVTLMKAAETL